MALNEESLDYNEAKEHKVWIDARMKSFPSKGIILGFLLSFPKV